MVENGGEAARLITTRSEIAFHHLAGFALTHRQSCWAAIFAAESRNGHKRFRAFCVRNVEEAFSLFFSRGKRLEAASTFYLTGS
jgi:hypothetical protein